MLKKLIRGEYLKNELKELLGLSRASRPKLVADSQDLEMLLRYLWLEDKHNFRHEIDRVKLHLYLLLLEENVDDLVSGTNPEL